MSTKAAPVRVDVATLQGSGPSMQDRVFVTDNAVVLLDGATDPDATEHDGGWIADRIGQRLAQALAAKPRLSLTEALADAIRTNARRHGLRPGAAPSTTVTIARWVDNIIDLLVLGDSPAVVAHRDGSITVIEDLRLSHLPGRAEFGPPQPGSSGRERSRKLVAYERSMRNTPDGYWIAEADPSAAQNALLATVTRDDTLAILLVSDGVADGINHYHEPPTWSEALTIARSGAKNLVEAVHATEEADVSCGRWPRSKIHDDKVAALISFTN